MVPGPSCMPGSQRPWKTGLRLPWTAAIPSWRSSVASVTGWASASHCRAVSMSAWPRPCRASLVRRVAIGALNEEAARFAAKYRILAGAGSDAHVAQGLGSVRVRMPDFDGPDEFLAALAEAEIRTKPSSLLYVQALKFLQTKATPPGARKASRERRVRRATRNG